MEAETWDWHWHLDVSSWWRIDGESRTDSVMAHLRTWADNINHIFPWHFSLASGWRDMKPFLAALITECSSNSDAVAVLLQSICNGAAAICNGDHSLSYIQWQLMHKWLVAVGMTIKSHQPSECSPVTLHHFEEDYDRTPVCNSSLLQLPTIDYVILQF